MRKYSELTTKLLITVACKLTKDVCDSWKWLFQTWHHTRAVSAIAGDNAPQSVSFRPVRVTYDIYKRIVTVLGDCTMYYGPLWRANVGERSAVYCGLM